MSGVAYNAQGWDLLNWIVFPVAALCLASLGWLAATNRRHAAAA